MTNKAPFRSSLLLKRNVFSRLQIIVRQKGLHNFAFYILIFAFSFQSLTPRSSSLTPNPSPLDPYFIVRKYLRLYICRDTFTDVMSALQIHLFMQNKAKFRKVKLNVNKVLTRDYEQLDTWSIRKKQSQTNPNKPNYPPPQTAKFTQFHINELRTMNNELITNKPNFRGKQCPI